MQSENFYSCEQGSPTLREDIHILDITWDTKIHRDIPSLFHLLEKIPLFVKVRYFGYPVWRDIVPKYVPFFYKIRHLNYTEYSHFSLRNLPIYNFSWDLRILRDNTISLWSIVGAIFGHKMGKIFSCLTWKWSLNTGMLQKGYQCIWTREIISLTFY